MRSCNVIKEELTDADTFITKLTNCYVKLPIAVI